MDFPEDLDLSGTDHVIERAGGRNKKGKPFQLKGPPDIVCRESYRKLLIGQKLNYPFLTAFENKLLMYRAVGASWAKLARQFSGGRDKRAFSRSSIKNLLHNCYDKIRINERVSTNIPLHIQYTVLHKKYRYRLKIRSKKCAN